MNTRVQLYKPNKAEQASVPTELANARGAALNNISIDMRLFGIQRITVNYRSVGLKTVLYPSFKPLPGEVPPAMEALRNDNIRRIAEYMVQFGLLDIELQPDAKDLEVIQQSWTNLRKQVSGDAKPSDAAPVESIQQIKLNIEPDPTTQSVLPVEESTVVTEEPVGVDREADNSEHNAAEEVHDEQDAAS